MMKNIRALALASIAVIGLTFGGSQAQAQESLSINNAVNQVNAVGAQVAVSLGESVNGGVDSMAANIGNMADVTSNAAVDFYNTGTVNVSLGTTIGQANASVAQVAVSAGSAVNGGVKSMAATIGNMASVVNGVTIAKP